MKMANITNNQLVGISWMIFHCFLISVMSAIIRIIAKDVHIAQIMFFYSFFAFIFLVPIILIGKRYEELKTNKLKLHISRSFLGAISLAIYFYALTVITLTQVRAVASTGPLVSSLMAVIFLKEAMGKYRIIALIIGFIGALLILRPWTDSFLYVSLMVVASVVMWSIIDLVIKTMSKTESNVCQIFYLTLGLSVFSMPAAIYYWQNMPIIYWLIMSGLGVIFLVNVLSVTNAFRHGEVTLIMPFDFSGMVFTIIIAYITFSEVIDVWTAIGSLIIMVSSIYIINREKKNAKKMHAIFPHEEV